MEKLAKNKAKFIGLSCLSISCLIGSFAYPLQKLEVYKQKEVGAFGSGYFKTFIITENELNYPYGYDETKAIKVSHIYTDYKSQKIILLVLSVLCAAYANGIGYETCINAEIDDEVVTIKSQGKKELIVKRIKHELAMKSKAQQLLFLNEMKALMEEFGSPEGEILQADELNATDKFINAEYLLQEGHSLDVVITQTWNYQPNTHEHTEMKRKFLEWKGDDKDSVIATETVNDTDFRKDFPENMDSSSWKAIQKALANNSTKEEIVKDVLGCSDSNSEMGMTYLEFLMRRFSSNE